MGEERYLEDVKVTAPNGAQDDGDGDEKMRLLLASAHLDDALFHRHIEFVPTDYHVRLYSWYKKSYFVFLVYFCYVVLVGLALFEKPAVPHLALPYWATTSVEFICISFFVFRFCHEMLFSNFKLFWKDTKHVTYAAILALIVIDILCYTIIRETAGDVAYAVRWSRPLRAFLIVNFPEPRQIRRAYRNIRNTLPDIVNVIILLLASVALFALMAVKLFGTKHLRKIDGEPYFSNFADAYWDLYVLITTANNPDITMPAYDNTRWYTLFFVIYLVINLYMFMSVFLAVVYNSYKDNLKIEVQESVYHKRNLLNKVYDLVKGSSDGFIERKTFLKLMPLVMPSETGEYFEILWMVLDVENTGRIRRKDFMQVVEVVNLKVTDIRDSRTLAEKWFPEVYTSTCSKAVIKCVKHVYFRYLFDLIIFVNAVCIAMDLDGGEWYFLAAFSLEIVLKLYSFGTRAFFRKLWNVFDVVVVGSALVVSVTQIIMHNKLESVTSLDILLVLRVIRIFKIFHSIPRFRIVINTMLQILPSMGTYGAIIVIFYYFFAMIGMEIFGGKIRFTGYGEGVKPEDMYCGNYKLKDSTFYTNHYCSNNFNNILSSFVTLFELMVVNQWHVITEGHVLVTQKAARLFFFFFHFTCVIVVLNIFSAFVIEAFILEYSMRASERPISPLVSRINQMGLAFGSRPAKPPSNRGSEDTETLVLEAEDVIDADHGSMQIAAEEIDGVEVMSSRTTLRFHLRKRNKTVQGLLEKMFENELKENDDDMPS